MLAEGSGGGTLGGAGGTGGTKGAEGGTGSDPPGTEGSGGCIRMRLLTECRHAGNHQIPGVRHSPISSYSPPAHGHLPLRDDRFTETDPPIRATAEHEGRAVHASSRDWRSRSARDHRRLGSDGQGRDTRAASGVRPRRLPALYGLSARRSSFFGSRLPRCRD